MDNGRILAAGEIVIGATITKIARTAIRRAEGTQLPFVADLVSTFRTSATIKLAAKAVFVILDETFTVAARAGRLGLAYLRLIADRVASSADATGGTATIGTTVLAVAVRLAEAFAVGVTGEAILARTARALAAIIATVLLGAVGQTDPRAGIEENLAKPQSLLLETGTFGLPVIFTLGNHAPEDLLDVVADANRQSIETGGDTIDLRILAGLLDDTIMGRFTGSLGPGRAFAINTGGRLRTRFGDGPPTPVGEAVRPGVALTAKDLGLTGEVEGATINTKIGRCNFGELA